jgi:hypothetical protein
MAGYLQNSAGLVSITNYAYPTDEMNMSSKNGTPTVFPYLLRTLGTTRYVLSAPAAVPGTTDPAFDPGVLAAETQPFEHCYATVPSPATPGAGPIPPPAASADPVPAVPASSGWFTVATVASGWEQVQLTLGNFTSLWRADTNNITSANTVDDIAASMAAYFNAQPMGGFYTFTVSGATVNILRQNGAFTGAPPAMTFSLFAMSPYDGGATTGTLTFSISNLTSPLGVLTGRRYAYAAVDSGGGFRSSLSPATLSSGPTAGNTSIWISSLPVSPDTRADQLELYACEDGQTPANAVWHKFDTLAFSAGVIGYLDTNSEATMDAYPVYPGPTQPAGTGDIIVTVTRNGVDYLQLRIADGDTQSNVISGIAMHTVNAGDEFGAAIQNNTSATTSLRVVLE